MTPDYAKGGVDWGRLTFPAVCALLTIVFCILASGAIYGVGYYHGHQAGIKQQAAEGQKREAYLRLILAASPSTAPAPVQP